MKIISGWRWCVLAAAACLVACTGAPPLQQSLGQLGGEIRFTYPDTAVGGYLSAHNVQASPDAVKVFAVGSPTYAATAGYAPVNVAVSASEWRAATYAISPPVDAGGTRFLVVADLQLDGGGSFRFGSSRSGTLDVHQSEPVMPQSSSGAGTTLDLVECAEMVNVTPTFSGAAADLDALVAPDPAHPYFCSVEASIEEPTGGSFFLQAKSSAETATLAQLRAGTKVISFPVRANGSRLTFKSVCATVPPAGSGFPLDNSGRAGFSGTSGPVRVDCPSGGGAPPNIPVDVPVTRTAGSVHGLFDLSGYRETYAQVTLNTVGSGQIRTATPAVPSNQPSPSSWSFDGIAVGPITLQAGAAVEGGSLALILPALNTPNPRQEIVANTDLNLGSTFVSRPVELHGRMLLVDKARTTRLDSLVNSSPLIYNGGAGTTFIFAGGDSAVVGDPPGSATGGQSYGRLDGTLPQNNPCLTFAQGCTMLNYRLLLGGLSAIDGATDGSQARRTAWDVTQAQLTFLDPPTEHVQGATLFFAREMHYYSTEPTQMPAGGIPDIAACFGQIELDMRVDAASGSLFMPAFAATLSPIAAAGTITGDLKSATGAAQGTPALENAAGPAASVYATLPEGASYLLLPSVRFKRNGPPTTVMLQSLRLPATGTLGCSEVVRACIKINDAGASATPLTVAIGEQAACQIGGSVTLPVSVDSAGVAIDKVSYTLDGGQPVTLCTDCGVNWTGSIGPLTLPPGQHRVVVTAESANQCVATDSRVFDIATGTPTCVAPMPFSVVLEPGETSIPASDPRIAGRLTPAVSGVCNAPVTLTDDRDGNFAPGTRTVHFSLNGTPACSTDVTVVKSKKQVAFFDINRLKLYRLEDDHFHWSVAAPGGAGPITFNSAGTRLAVRTVNQIAFFDADTGAVLGQDGGAFFDFAYRPGSTDDRAYVEYFDNGPGNPPDLKLKLVLGGVTSYRQLPGSPVPAGVRLHSARVAWSPDGARVVVAYNRSAAGDYRLMFAQWTVTGTTIGAAPTSGDWALPDGEDVRGVAYEQGVVNGLYLFATTAKIYRLLTDLIPWPLITVPTSRIDMHRSWLLGVDLGPQPPFFAFLWEYGVLSTVATPAFNAPLDPVKGVAVSDFPISLPSTLSDPILGVALTEYVSPNQRKQMIALFRLGLQPGAAPTLVLERKIPAQEPAFPTFRPYTP